MNKKDDNIGIHLPYDQICSSIMHNTSVIFSTNDAEFCKRIRATCVTLLHYVNSSILVMLFTEFIKLYSHRTEGNISAYMKAFTDS